MRPGTPDNGQAAKRDSLWVLDIALNNDAPATGAPRQSCVRTQNILAIDYQPIHDRGGTN